MRPTAVVMVGALLASAAGAQPPAVAPKAAVAMHLLQLPDLTRFDEPEAQSAPAAERFAAVMRRLPVAAGQQAVDVRTNVAPGRHIVLVRGVAEHAEVVRVAIGALGRPDPPAARLQCSVVSVPAELAAAHRLRAGEAVVVAGHVAAELLRDAVRANGTLHNLPEIVAAPLAPFASERRPVGDTDGLRARGHSVPLGANEVLVAIDLERLPASPAGKPAATPTVLLSTPSFRLVAGQCAVLRGAGAHSAVALLVRCVAVEPPGAK